MKKGKTISQQEKEMLERYLETGLMPKEIVEIEDTIQRLQNELATQEFENMEMEAKNDGLRDRINCMVSEAAQQGKPKSRIPWLESVLLVFSGIMACLAWTNMETMPMASVYWTGVTGYWAIAAWKRQKNG